MEGVGQIFCLGVPAVSPHSCDICAIRKEAILLLIVLSTPVHLLTSPSVRSGEGESGIPTYGAPADDSCNERQHAFSHHVATVPQELENLNLFASVV